MNETVKLAGVFHTHVPSSCYSKCGALQSCLQLLQQGEEADKAITHNAGIPQTNELGHDTKFNGAVTIR